MRGKIKMDYPNIINMLDEGKKVLVLDFKGMAKCLTFDDVVLVDRDYLEEIAAAMDETIRVLSNADK
jgi:hypothetical protein